MIPRPISAESFVSVLRGCWLLCCLHAWAQPPVGQAIGPTAGVAGYPQVAITRSRVHVVYTWDSQPATRPQLFIISSSDNGRTFSNPLQVGVTETAARRPAVAVGSRTETIYVVWAETDSLSQSGRIRLTKSTDGGQAKAFLQPTTVSSAGLTLNPRVALDNDENVYVVWETGGSSIFQRQIRLARSDDAGQTFSAPRNLSATGSYASPNLLWSRGKLHVVWREVGEGRSAVFYIQSADRGETWTAPSALNGTSATSAPQDDFLPLFGAGGQAIGILVLDAARYRERLLYLHSADEGAVFAAPVAVSGVNEPSPQSAGFLAPFSESAGKLGAMWIGMRSLGGAATPTLYLSCTAEPSRFSDSRPLIDMPGAARELMATADASGLIHAVVVHQMERDSKVIYSQSRCPPSFAAAAVVSAGSQQGGGLVPGGLATIYGADLGPATGLGAQIDEKTGLVRTGLGGVQVLVDDVAAPLLFVRRDQVNFQVPIEIAQERTARLAVSVSGLASAAVELPVVSAQPAFFTLNGSGGGPVVAQNEDGSLNTLDDRAPRGSIVTLYATGQGLVTPAVRTGQLGPDRPPFPVPVLRGTLFIDGRLAEVAFGGLAPFFLGVLQINARIPNEAAPGAVPIILRVGDASSPPGTTLAVR